MNFSENFRLALRALAANKLRSALTMLGIVIGVGSVIALMALGNGATASITEQVQGIGANLITVFPGRQQLGPQANTASASAPLYFSDYTALDKNLDEVVQVVPAYQSNQTVAYNKTSLTTQVTGSTADYADVRAYDINLGRFLTEQDQARQAKVAVLGSQTAHDLFGNLNPVGREIKIGNLKFEVVGVLESKGSSGFTNEDEAVLIPLETGYEKLFGANATSGGQRTVSTIYVSAADAEVVDEVIVQIERLLRREHGLKLTDELDFSAISQASLLDTLGSITTTLTAFLGFIAAISLMVGGIGVMNIMLVSVTERTREIGLRKAVGAKDWLILMQFLIETLTLTLFGGLLGIGVGWLVAALVRAADLIEATVTTDSVAIAFVVTLLVGVFAGLYPAWRASRLRPIEALRYE